jgi:hypothetical protein
LAREEKGGKPKSQASRGGGHIEEGQTKQKTKKKKKRKRIYPFGVWRTRERGFDAKKGTEKRI